MLKRIGWLIVLWLAGVAAAVTLATALRALMRLSGLAA
jgi:hypothetical protein